MERQEIVDQAIEFLKNLDLSKVETLEVNNTNYDDHSNGIEISVMFYPRLGAPKEIRSVNEE